ncbi:MAG: hypothetical protein ACKO0Z_01485 [Betaproteobacteria bacterium]
MKFSGNEIKPDVDKLMEHFDLHPGDVILHQDIAHVANARYQSNRYRSIIVAWRRRLLREKNIDIAPKIGHGYFVLSDNERVSYGVTDFEHSVRKMGKSADRVSRADAAKMDDTHRRQRDHSVRLMSELMQAARNTKKQISLAGGVDSVLKKRLAAV